MQRYAALLLPSANRVYAANTQQMALAEITAFQEALPSVTFDDLQSTTIGGVPYITFNANNLDAANIELISNCSCLYALFESSTEHTETFLKPIGLTPLDRYPSDLISILKFSGKTNEQFTKLLLNLTLLASEHLPMISANKKPSHNVRLLDPLCGRGTTINQAIMYGFDAAGVEIDKRDFEAYGVFINRWLKDNRIKHQSNTIALKQDSKTLAHRHQITFANDKHNYKQGETQSINFVQGDTLNSADYFKRNSFELIVADLPYGVKHGNQSSKGLSKSPITLLEQAVPVWASLLRPGGAMGLSWNTFLAKKTQVLNILESAGLCVHEPTRGPDFRHRVDQAIMRDLVVVTRPLSAK